MEIFNHRRKMLDDMGSNAKGNDNFVIKVISMENVDGKSYIFKKIYRISKNKESNLFFLFFKLLPWATSLKVLWNLLWNSIVFLKFWPVIYKEWFFWKDHHHYHHHHIHQPFASLFCMLFRIYDMGKASHAHLNARLYT